MKKVLLIFPVIILMAAGCNQVADTSVQAPSTANQQTNNNRVSQKTYVNTEYDYQFNYEDENLGYLSPEGGAYMGSLNTDEATSTNILIVGDQQKQKIVIEADVVVPNYMKTSGILQNNRIGDNTIWYEPTVVSINGITYKKYVPRSGMFNANREVYLAENGKYYYFIGISDQQVGSKILSTFKFTQ